MWWRSSCPRAIVSIWTEARFISHWLGIFVAQAAGHHLTLASSSSWFSRSCLPAKAVGRSAARCAGNPAGQRWILSTCAWPVLLILGIDQFMAMARTATNVLGNCLASAVVARWEGELSTETPSPAVADAWHNNPCFHERTGAHWSHPSRNFRWRGGEITRLEGFTDAVFAFAVTLLVVSLEVPHTFENSW